MSSPTKEGKVKNRKIIIFAENTSGPRAKANFWPTPVIDAKTPCVCGAAMRLAHSDHADVIDCHEAVIVCSRFDLCSRFVYGMLGTSIGHGARHNPKGISDG
jgi:hypothetical protein